jgi:ribose/xylose/arabinose/galactoside ABC-type transport system permease subunit
LRTDNPPGVLRGIIFGPHAARQILLLVTTCLLALGFGLASPDFLSLSNFLNIGLQTSVISILAFAMTCVIVARGIDLSVGSTVAVAGIIGALTLQAGWPPLLALIVILLVGLGIGTLNGLLVTVIGVSPFLATLGTLALGRGASLSLSEASSIDVGQPLILWFGSSRVLGVPAALIMALVLLFCFWFLLNRTVFGRWVFAVGGNAGAARASTIPVRWTQFLTYLLTGVAAGIGSVITVGRLGSAQPLAGEGLEFAAITAVIVGGTKLSGGEGSIVSTFLGAVLVGVITAGLSFLGVRQEITYIITGILILLAVLTNQLEIFRSPRWFGGSSKGQAQTEEAE